MTNGAFEGHVVSDCWALKDFHENHCVTATAPESAALAMKYGCDAQLRRGVPAGACGLSGRAYTEEQITTACERLMTTRFLLGILGPEGSEYDKVSYAQNDTAVNAKLAQTVAERAWCCLKTTALCRCIRIS